MLELLLTAALILPVPVQDDDEPKPPDPARVKATVESVEKALKSGTPEERVQTLTMAREVVHADVVKAVARGLKHKEKETKNASIESLRFMHHPDSLDTLHKVYKKDKAITKDVDLYAALLRAIAQHRNPSSIAVLSDNPFQTPDHKTIRSRILGLGYIRDKRSVEALFGMLNKVGPLKAQGVMKEFRIALMALTGVDQGESRDLWIRWWNENKKTFELPKKEPRLPKNMQEQWDYYWGIYHKKDRGEEREERGDDPEDDDA